MSNVFAQIGQGLAIIGRIEEAAATLTEGQPVQLPAIYVTEHGTKVEVDISLKLAAK